MSKHFKWWKWKLNEIIFSFYYFFFSFSNEIELNEQTKLLAEKNGFDVAGYSFSAQEEELRKPRIVRVRKIKFRK